MRVVRSPSAPPTSSVRQRDATQRSLAAAIGADDFYAAVAVVDPGHAAAWRRMVKVQGSFKDAEVDPSFDGAMRTYSASNRETLHRLVVSPCC